MLVKVIKSFVDKKCDAVREVNEQFEVDEERFKEIEKAGAYVVKVPEVKKAE